MDDGNPWLIWGLVGMIIVLVALLVAVIAICHEALHKQLAGKLKGKKFTQPEDVTEEEAQKAEVVFTQACPDAEISVLAGGQPVYYYIVSIE